MPKSNLPKWTTNSSKYLADSPWVKVRADSATTPDGHIIEPFYVFEYPEWVNCLVIDDQEDVILIHQYRHGAGEYIPEIVGGAVDPEDKSLESGIKRELEEEIGYIGGALYHVGSSYPNPATHTNRVHSFLAVGGSCSIDQRLEKGENLHRYKMPFSEYIKMMHTQHTDATYQALHIATLFFVENFIKQSEEPQLRKLQKYL